MRAAAALALGLALPLQARSHPYADEVLRAAPPEAERCDPDRWLAMARAYADERRREEVAEALDRAEACQADPTALSAHRALLAAQLQAPTQALPLLDEALRLAPEHRGLRMARARALLALGLPAEAALDWEQALAAGGTAQPDDVLGWISALRETGQHHQALQRLDAFIGSLGPAPALVDAALQLELELGWTRAAQARLDGLPDTSFWRPRREQLRREAPLW